MPKHTYRIAHKGEFWIVERKRKWWFGWKDMNFRFVHVRSALAYMTALAENEKDHES